MADLGSVNTYQAFVETEKAGHLIRQWIGSNLYDRVRWVWTRLERGQELMEAQHPAVSGECGEEVDCVPAAYLSAGCSDQEGV